MVFVANGHLFRAIEGILHREVDEFEIASYFERATEYPYIVIWVNTINIGLHCAESLEHARAIYSAWQTVDIDTSTQAIFERML